MHMACIWPVYLHGSAAVAASAPLLYVVQMFRHLVSCVGTAAGRQDEPVSGLALCCFNSCVGTGQSFPSESQSPNQALVARCTHTCASNKLTQAQALLTKSECTAVRSNDHHDHQAETDQETQTFLMTVMDCYRELTHCVRRVTTPGRVTDTSTPLELLIH